MLVPYVQLRLTKMVIANLVIIIAGVVMLQKEIRVMSDTLVYYDDVLHIVQNDKLRRVSVYRLGQLLHQVTFGDQS